MNNIGIIGGAGFVGQILRRYYPDAKWSDKDSDDKTIAEVLSCDIIFVAVNFQDNCASEESKAALDRYFNPISGKTIIIKSTFIPGTLDWLQNKYPQNNFIYNPEWLTEMTALMDFTNPKFQILGVPHQSLHLVHDIFAILPDAPIKRIISPLDAEVLKHATNSYYASKVIWFNQLYDATKQLGADYETVREIMVQDPRIGDSHSVIWHKGYRGFGGKCLSKDPLQLSKIVSFPLLDKVIELNDHLLGK